MTLKTVEIVDVNEEASPLSTASFEYRHLTSILVQPKSSPVSLDVEPKEKPDLRLVDTGQSFMGKRVYIESDGEGDSDRMKTFLAFMYPDRGRS